MFINSGPSGAKFSGGLGALLGPWWGSSERNPLKLREFCLFSTLKTNFFLVPNCMGFEQLKHSPPQTAASQQQSPEKHKLMSHSKQEDKKPLRSYQFGSSAHHLVIYVFAVCPILMLKKSF